jgi:hypothetical protein
MFSFLTEISGVHLMYLQSRRLRIDCELTTDYGSNLTFCIVCVFTVQTDEWFVHNRLFNVSFDETFK